ncbi:FoF1 ATP synthase subunit gamma [Candidatus Anaplasma sp. TIGMIC]|uniref:F0F1 ATP synthase subunit gamma n=1 Tax=Candidatus Anaplasma sp. TIGMIC TaxID=3020713 RepID=UPI00232B4D95|nr:FoF1 ATP synthase subunit gamma [Candidatus Anaplasma sp. TIGMIC]MDB1135640.1 F0F1 ATP synthase subunit gamma [Candidatus Anaplasma sp. TIGMIC]
MTRRQELIARIRSVKSIQKTTRVMQMISASKFRAARGSLVNARQYCDRVMEMSGSHPYSRVNDESSSSLLIVFSSDRGLCGGFNHSIVKVLRGYLSSHSGETELNLLFVGRKAYDSVRGSIGENVRVLGVVQQPKGLSFDSFKGLFYKLGVDLTSFSTVSALYCKFTSISLHEPVVGEVLGAGRKKDDEEQDVEDSSTWSYDPCREEIGRKLWANSIVGRIYLYLCESVTCEHCSRMISMESANTNTQSMLKKLILDYNRSRQAAITGDLIEIVSGCEAAG